MMKILTVSAIFINVLLTWALEKGEYYTALNELNNTQRDIYHSMLNVPVGLQPVRKCCLGDEFYSGLTQQCEKISSIDKFRSDVKELLIRSDDIKLSLIYKRIKACPETLNIPKNVVVSSNSSHHLFQDGSVFDSDENRLYNITHYCLEMVGHDVGSSVLVFAYCPPKEYFIPKCCPKDHYFDTRINDCSAYYSINESEGDSALLPHLVEDHYLLYQELYCLDPPSNVTLRKTQFNENNLCLDNVQSCYTTDKYCVENYLDVSDNSLYPVAFVCPDYFVNKCCPDEQSLFMGGCARSERRSASIIHMLKNHRYQIKSTFKHGRTCSPLTIEDETRSDIAWEIDSYGVAVITKENKTIYTRNYCIDDLVTETEVLPVIKVCSEEINEYHEVHIKDWKNVLGKCCPSGMVYHLNTTREGSKSSCMKQENLENYSVENIKKHMPQLIFSSFPSCENGKETYHHYEFFNKSVDYAELTPENNLKVVTKDNECTTKEYILDPENFCMDLMVFENKMKSVAIICTPSSQTPHPERNSMTVAFIGVSCVALILTLFSLIFTRVRRGMVTMKKINTLAGRILISYVTCQLVSFVSLIVGVLVDFAEDIYNCVILGGFILFFSIASFCWNTSICLEGLLLTLHVKTPERKRFLCHCLWAWGVPSLITAVALIKDAHREELPCDAITPKFGLEQCFFSDLVAKILYFLLPISITVLLNGIFLITARIIRRKQLKELEKDPHRIRRQGTLKEVFSIKNKKSIKLDRLQKSNHSGLRTHQLQNVWLESTKLAMWSGGTWIMEIVAVTITLHFGRSKGEWYQHLWYIPVGFNCLRGVGIFIIIVLTPDNKSRFMRTVKKYYTDVGQGVSKSKMILYPHHARAKSKKAVMRLRSKSATVQPLNEVPHKEEERKISVSTVLTYMPFETTESLKRPAQYCRSVSEYDTRRPSNSSLLSDVFEVSEHDVESHVLPEDFIDNISTIPNSDQPFWSICIEDMEYCTHL